jgi:hypothetical protein
MRRPKWFLLLHPVFLFALIILVLNDNWWKYSYPGWLTGKLSDFAGVFVFTLFLFVLIPARRVFAACVSAFIFLWWKSSFSEPFIYWVNNNLHFPVKRVIDYSDTLAILVIPFTFYVKPLAYNLTSPLKKFLKPALFVSTLTAICATSAYRVNDAYYPKGHFSLDKGYKTHLTEHEILGKLDSMQIPYRRDSVEMMPVYPTRYSLRTNGVVDSPSHWLELTTFKDTILYYKNFISPFYIIPKLSIGSDTLFNVMFRISIGKRVNEIRLVSAEVPPSIDLGYQNLNVIDKKYSILLKSILAN